MAKTDKAAQLRKIAAKVREVAGACNEDGIWSACIAIGPLFKDAYEAGAWQREGSQIGDKLKRVSTDRQQLLRDGQTPVWKFDAWLAVVGPLVDHLTPVDGGEKENLEFEAGIAADEIEEEARRIETGREEPEGGYLGIHVDDEHRELKRDGFPNVTAQFGKTEWHIVKAAFSAGERGATKAEWMNGYPGDVVGKGPSAAKSRIRSKLKNLGLTLADGEGAHIIENAG